MSTTAQALGTGLSTTTNPIRPGLGTSTQSIGSNCCCDVADPCLRCSVEQSLHAQPVGGVAKRLFDIVFSALALLAFAPMFILVALLTKLISPGPIFYGHERIGLKGQRFKCLKFRTMRVDADDYLQYHLANNPAARAEYEKSHKLRNDPRVTPGIGNFLRKTSLDEIPQFINVLLGHMSVVGPRPVTLKEIDYYRDVKPAYLSVRPGITGPWQVSGRSDLSYDSRVALDQTYVNRWSFSTDIAIVLRTVVVMLTGRGAY